MPSCATYFLIVAAIGLSTLALIVGLTYLVSIPMATAQGALIVAILSLVFSLIFMRWLGNRVDAIWKNPQGNPAGSKLIREIASWSSVLTCLMIVFVAAAYSIAILLFLPPNNLAIPLQPVLTFLFSGAWFAYLLYAIMRLAIAEGDTKADLARYARNSVIGAIVLSLYFLIPFDWFAQSGLRAFETVVYGQSSGREFYFASTNSTIVWLQSTAIPSVVSIGFAFLIAYVTSLVWYEYYKSFTDAGLITVNVSRRGRDPTQDDFWYGRLQQTKSRAILCGATLGGWFQNWDRLRFALHEFLAREFVEQILIVLPEPGNSFFWQRRHDELSQLVRLWEDPIARLARAIEMIYLMLPEPDDDKKEAFLEFLEKYNLQDDAKKAEEFFERFEKEFAAKLDTFEQNPENRNFLDFAKPYFVKSVETIKKYSDVPEIEIRKLISKIGFVFVRGTLMAVNVIDEEMYYSPYLPTLEDRDCPKLTIGTQSPLGRQIDRAVEGMARDGIWVLKRSDALAIAFRLWSACRNKKVPLDALSEIPVWLSAN